MRVCHSLSNQTVEVEELLPSDVEFLEQLHFGQNKSKPSKPLQTYHHLTLYCRVLFLLNFVGFATH